MCTLPRFVLTFATLACLALPALADEIVGVDGTSHSCEILEVEEDGVTVRGKMKSGETVELKVPVARIDPHCYYGLRDAALGDDAKARMRFALWCVDNDLLAQAKVQAQKAAKADPQLLEDLAGGKYPEIREKIAARVLASAERDISAGQFDVARQKLEMLLARLSDTEAGGKACEVIRQCEAKHAEAETKAAADAQAKLDETARKAAEGRAKLLSEVDSDLAKGRAVATDGLTEDDHGKALGLLEKALGHGEAAMKKLDAIEKRYPDDAELQTEAAKRRTKLLQGMVKVHVHRSDLYVWRGSIPNAQKELEAARKLVPSSPEIDAAAQRILAAEEEDDTFETRYLRERRQSGSRFPTATPRGGGRR